jgi:thiol-disulfide isomerase/thioredoxin
VSLRSLRGQVVLVDFWDYTCVNCIRTLPYLREWHSRYKNKGLTIVGVHAPEFYFGSVSELVQLAMRDFGIEYPVLLDNEYQVWQAFANRYWPSKYLIDTEGYMRYFHPGEGGYGETETAVQMLLRERDPRVELPSVMSPLRAMDVPGAMMACQRPTPELYLGAKRGRIANPEGMVEGESQHYRFGANLPEDTLVELEGEWLIRPESAQARSADAKMRFSFAAAEVNLVLAATAECPVARLEIEQDGLPLPLEARGDDVRVDSLGRTYVEVTRPRMYSLIRREYFVTGLLKLSTQSLGLDFFALTFTSCV